MTNSKKLLIVAGARPNFMKIAPILRELKLHQDVFDWRLVHTGQHYDKDMSTVFFEELGIPAPDFYLDAGGGTHAQQTGRIMERFEVVCQKWQPDLVIVVGDVNSTLAASIVAKKAGSKVAHVEAGLRSGDMSMPEEINRIVTDAITDYFFVTEPSGIDNLIREGHEPSQLFFVGHVMIDNLYHQLSILESRPGHQFSTSPLKRELETGYGVLTLHRPSNVDDPVALSNLIAVINQVSVHLPLLFVVHPRTASIIERHEIGLASGVHLLRPLPYMEFLNLWKDARLVLTDSGGLQEETTALGVPCITLRENTERPITVTDGSNVLVGSDSSKILRAVELQLQSGKQRESRKPELWDGAAASRIVEVLRRVL